MAENKGFLYPLFFLKKVVDFRLKVLYHIYDERRKNTINT